VRLEALRRLGELLDPTREPDRKPSTVELNPLDVWLYLTSSLPKESEETTPSPRTVLMGVTSLLGVYATNAHSRLVGICRNSEEIANDIAGTLDSSTRGLKSLLGEAPEIHPGMDEKSFVNIITEAKNLALKVGGIILPLETRISGLCRACRGAEAPRKCCEECLKLYSSIVELLYDVTPLLDTCYSDEEASRVYNAVRTLYRRAEDVKGDLGYKALATALSIIALEVTQDLGPTLEWASGLVKTRLALRKWVWRGDLAMLVYAIQAIVGFQRATISISRDELASILHVLANL